MKKTLIAILLILVLCTGVFALVACNKNDPNQGGSGGNNSGGGGSSSSVSHSTTIGYSVASSATMLSAFANGSATSAVDAASLDPAVTDAFEQEIGKQLAVIDSFIDRASVNAKEEASDIEGYAHKLTVTTTDLLGNESTFVLYYNATPLADEDDDRWDDEDDWDIDNEQEFRITGELDYNGTKYKVVGTMESEQEGRETESEFEMYAYDLNTLSYILFEQSFEQEDGEYEEEYKYSYFVNATERNGILVNGTLDNSFEIEFENENGKEELEVMFIGGASAEKWANTVISYDKETISTGEQIKVTLSQNRVAATVYVTNVNGKYNYRFIGEDSWNTLYNSIFGSTQPAPEA